VVGGEGSDDEVGPMPVGGLNGKGGRNAYAYHFLSPLTSLSRRASY